MSLTKNKKCYMDNNGQTNKSIFNYIVDNSMYINKNECNNYVAPFLTYIPTGVSSRNVDIENDLKGMNRPFSKCEMCKYMPEHQHEHANSLPIGEKIDVYPNNKQECTKQYNILPNGYIQQ